MQSPVRFLSIFLVLSVILSGCGAIPALFATPTPIPTATQTSTPTPIPTATPSPTPTPLPTGVSAQTQSDGSTLITDYDLGYQLAIGADWKVYLRGPDGWSSTLGNLPDDPEAADWMKEQIEGMEGESLRALAVPMTTVARPEAADQFAGLLVAAQPVEGNCIPVDFVAAQRRQLITSQGLKATSEFFRNPHGVEIGSVDVPSVGSSFMFFCEHGGTVVIAAQGRVKLPPATAATLDTIAGTISLLPASPETIGGMSFMDRPGDGTLVVDEKLGYQFELDETWHPVVVTAENAQKLIMNLMELDWGFDPDWHRLVAYTHVPEYVTYHAAHHYAVCLIVGRVDTKNQALPMADFLAALDSGGNRVRRTEVTVNSRGVEIGTVEVTTTAHGHTFTKLPVRFLWAHFKVGDVMMRVILQGPEIFGNELRPAFEKIIDTIELIKT